MYYQAGRSLSCCHIRRHRGQRALQAGRGSRAGEITEPKGGLENHCKRLGEEKCARPGDNHSQKPHGRRDLGCLSNSQAQWRGAQCGRGEEARTWL